MRLMSETGPGVQLGVDRLRCAFAVIRPQSRAYTLDRVVSTTPERFDLTYAELVARHRVTRAIFSLRNDQSLVDAYPHPKGVPQQKRYGAAQEYAKTLMTSIATTRVIQAQPAYHTVVVVRNDAVAELTASLTPLLGLVQTNTIDVAGSVWLRLAGSMIVDSREDPCIILSDERGPFVRPLRLEAEPGLFAASVRQLLFDHPARHVEHLLYWSDRADTERQESVAKALADLHITIEPLVLHGHANPSWAFAYALAAWGIL